MRIAVPAEGTMIESNVSQSFGRTYYFVVADTETLEFEVIDNQAASSQGGAGIQAAQAVVDSGAVAVVAFHCGQNAADVLKAADIKILKAVPGTIAEMVQKYKAGELAELSEIHAGHMASSEAERNDQPGYHQHGGE